MQAASAVGLESVASEILAAVAAAGSATDEQLSNLHFLYDSHFAKALQIVDQGGVWCFVGASSGRRVYQAFFFDVVSKAEAAACKHQLAARLADALNKTRVQTVSDIALGHLLAE
ncbi:hypothetical protein D9Q98_004657 [Chlorella vulgaris]|uniref:Uncharacterized protein n=1 Tax=Chlorella vulgaris TaxID=3077 RepID=A0A9D4TQ15_CHLVU|nr:hypothetical protein D9Q98_004657 [Chlorella vulgaris]